MNTLLSPRTLLLIVGAVALFGGGVWMGRVEAPTQEDIAVVEVATSTSTPTDATATTSQTTATTTPSPSGVASGTPKPPSAALKPVVATAAKAPQVALITYDGEYFSPRDITILQGGTVRFMNLSKEDMWVASNLHPVHSGYPEKNTKSCSGYAFDMCKAVGKNGTWEFTFTRQGAFSFHNHLRPISTGRIEVNSEDEKPSIPGY
jgi:hypothetical protein